MSRIFVFVLVLLVASSAYSKGVGNVIALQATTYADGVLFEATGISDKITLSVSGPGKSAFVRQYSSSQPIFINVHSESGGPLPDGLYKYEAQPAPAFSMSRGESSKLPDRNQLVGKSEPKSSPVSGHFRVLNGMVVDPDIDETESGPTKGKMQ